MEPALAVSLHMWATFAVIFGAIVLYASDRYSVELISIGTVCALILLFHLAPFRDPEGEIALSLETLLSGFSNPALAAVMGLIIIGQGVTQSGAMDRPTGFLLSVYERRPAAVIACLFLLIMATSAFLNDTPVVVMFLPIIAAVASRGGATASQLMMPLSFVALFGGMTTVIGSSTNVLAAGVYRASTGEAIGFFEPAPMALVIGAVGLVYLATAGRVLLPRRTSEIQRSRSEGKHFIAQFTIEPGNSLIGTGASAGLFPSLPNVTVRLVQRGGKAILPPFEKFSFQSGDVVVVAVTREALTTLLKTRRDILSGLASEVEPDEENARDAGGGQLQIAEAIIAPASHMIGRTIAQTGFTLQTGCLILGVERRSRMVRAEMNTLRLESGDVLLILGSLENMRALRFDRDLIVLEWSMIGIPGKRHALAAALIFAFVVLSAASGLLPIPIAALTGVLAMLATGCLNMRQAARSFDRRVYLLIGASLAMGAALEATGGAAFLGGAIVRASETYGAAALLSTMFILSAVLTNVLSNNATAVLLTPVAVSAAQQAGLDPLPFALTVIYGANCPFATPIAYQTNLLVMTPGHYKFRDFLVVGGPLIILLWIAYSFIAPFYFGLN